MNKTGLSKIQYSHLIFKFYITFLRVSNSTHTWYACFIKMESYASPNKGARMDFAKLNNAFDIIASGTSIELTG